MPTARARPAPASSDNSGDVREQLHAMNVTLTQINEGNKTTAASLDRAFKAIEGNEAALQTRLKEMEGRTTECVAKLKGETDIRIKEIDSNNKLELEKLRIDGSGKVKDLDGRTGSLEDQVSKMKWLSYGGFAVAVGMFGIIGTMGHSIVDSYRTGTARDIASLQATQLSMSAEVNRMSGSNESMLAAIKGYRVEMQNSTATNQSVMNQVQATLQAHDAMNTRQNKALDDAGESIRTYGIRLHDLEAPRNSPPASGAPRK